MPFDPTFVGLAIFPIPVGLSRLHPALVCVCVCARSPVQGAGGCDSQPLETLFGDFIDACLQHSGVLGTLQLCHIRTSWQHLFLSLWRGTELPPCCHKVLPLFSPLCLQTHKAFRVCPHCCCGSLLCLLCCNLVLTLVPCPHLPCPDHVQANM